MKGTRSNPPSQVRELPTDQGLGIGVRVIVINDLNKDFLKSQNIYNKLINKKIGCILNAG